MIRNFTKNICGILMLSMVSFTTLAQQSYYYDFRNTLNEKSGSGPALLVLGTGTFVDESLPDLSCLERTTYSFTQNSGVQFDNGAAGNFMGNSYSIEMYFKYTDNTGFMRVLDFKNRTSDFGLYATNSVLQFYDELTVATNAFMLNQYVHLVLTRNGSTDDVSMYINGVFLGSFVDNSNSATLDGSNVLNFFQDDLVFGGEARPGNIALLKIYDFTLDASEVEDNFNELEKTSGVVAFSSDIQSSCLFGNVFNFTNESENVGTVSYTWEFGDGNTATGFNASHSYSTDGFFTVLLIADDGSGCIDTASVDIEIFLSPFVDLGLDLDVCDGEIAILNAGPGFVTYLWNDGSTNQDLMVSQAGTYYVEVTDALGCIATDTIVINIIANPVFSLGADTVICSGSTITLSAPSGMVSYFWSTNETSESIVVNTSGIYAVEIVNFDGCTASDTIEITINPDVIISLGNDTTICDGQTLTLDPGQNFQDYLWSDGSTASTLDVTTGGFYSVTVTDNAGCTGSSFITVFVNAPPVVNLGADTTICGGSILTLDAGPGFITYLWNDGSSNQTLDINAAGTYSVLVSDGSGCEGQDEITVTTDPFVSLGNDITLCDGLTATLDPVDVFTTYLWSDGSTASTLDVTVTGTYTLTVTDANGCINSDEIDVTFSPGPIVDLGTDVDICDGDMTTLDAGTGFTSYLWSDGSSAQTLDVMSAGNYTVTVTDSNGCTGQDDIQVNVNPVPVVELGPNQNICAGTATVLDAGSGGTSYLWSDGSSSQMLLVFASGTYTVTVTNSFGCSASDDVTVTLFNAPVVALGADTTLCSGETLVLDAGPGFAGYLWSGGDVTQTITVNSTGNYTVTVTDANGCTGQDDIEVDYYAPVPTPSIVQIGNTLQSSAPSGNQWYAVPGGLIPGATNNTYDPPADGTYYVVVTDPNGCESDPSPDFMFILSGISTVSGMSFTIAPNPSSGFISVQMINFVPGALEIKVSDLSGKLVHNEIRNTGHSFTMDLSSFKQGVYFIRIGNDKFSRIQKLVITQ